MGSADYTMKSELEVLSSVKDKYNFEGVNTFIYLRIQMDENGGEDKEIKTRIVKYIRKYASLRPLLKPINTTVRIYRTILWPTVLKKSEKAILDILESKVPRCINGENIRIIKHK